MKRRAFIAGVGTFLAAPLVAKGAWAAKGGRTLPVPPLIDTGASETALVVQYGRSPFLDGVMSRTWGYGQAYLGPTLRMTRGQVCRMRLRNDLNFPITCHWHGMHIDGDRDGGPHQPVAPGASWAPELPVDQPAATLWYHSHSHGVTAEQVYGGLAGMIQIEDPDAPVQLPSTYGVDDLPLIVQDKAFNEAGGLHYVKRGPALMHGFRGDQILVNGAIRPDADVPAGLVRLRILNGSNARIYHFAFEDGRVFHQVASDGGLLAAPLPLTALSLAPAERAEIVVDFSNGAKVRLLSGPDRNDPMAGGMMGGMMARMLPPPPPQAENAQDGVFEVMRFTPDVETPPSFTALPDAFVSAPAPDFGDPLHRRRFALNMMGSGMGRMNINGTGFSMDRIDVEMRAGETELWTVTSDEMAHPFHVHGTHFKVVSHNGAPVDFATTGMKDVFLVNGEAEILVRLDRKADKATPFMFHCHILEHEDAGMMGQFTVA